MEKIVKLKSSGKDGLTHPIRPLLRFHYYSLKVGRPGNMHWCPQKRLKIIRAGDLKEFTIEEIQHKTGPIHDKEKMGSGNAGVNRRFHCQYLLIRRSKK